MAVAAWATALVQVAGSSASVAVPALTFFYAWKNKHYIEAVIFGSFFVALFPWALQIIRKSYALLHWLGSNKGPISTRPLRRGSKRVGDKQALLMALEACCSPPGRILETPCRARELQEEPQLPSPPSARTAELRTDAPSPGSEAEGGESSMASPEGERDVPPSPDVASAASDENVAVMQ
mmetsp:Transcript_29940/g.64554  ORF Transcript_29940/g.64554 Transcript_29940/m.64554 type:complete len:180 (-) Transcript_29940:147-686(-)